MLYVILYQTILFKSSDSLHFHSTKDYSTIFPIKLIWIHQFTKERPRLPCKCRNGKKCFRKESAVLKIKQTKVLFQGEKSQRNISTSVLLRIIGSSTTTIIPCHSEMKAKKIAQHIQVSHGSFFKLFNNWYDLTFMVSFKKSNISNISKRCLRCLNWIYRYIFKK